MGIYQFTQIDDSVELLSTFQLFCHNHGRLPLTNGLLIVPDSEVLEGEEKINLKNLYELFRYTKSHGLVSIQFLGALSLFFGVGTGESKSAITELYRNLSYATLSGAYNFNFDAISNLISSFCCSIKKITLANRDRREVEDAKNAKKKNQHHYICTIA